MDDDYEAALHSFKFQGNTIPQYMWPGILRYLQKGILPGDFLKAILSNDLRDACERADHNNAELLPTYVAFFYNRTPGICWGSKEKMLAWHESFQEKAA